MFIRNFVCLLSLSDLSDCLFCLFLFSFHKCFGFQSVSSLCPPSWHYTFIPNASRASRPPATKVTSTQRGFWGTQSLACALLRLTKRNSIHKRDDTKDRTKNTASQAWNHCPQAKRELQTLGGASQSLIHKQLAAFVGHAWVGGAKEMPLSTRRLQRFLVQSVAHSSPCSLVDIHVR